MKKVNKTLVIVTPYFSADSGGVQRYVYEIATRLQRDYKWRIVIIASGEKNGKDEKLNESGLTIYKLGYKYKFSNSPFSLNWFKKINKIIKDERPDVIDIQSPVPGIGNVAALVARKTPVIVSYHAGSMHKGKLLFDLPIWIYEHLFLHLLLRRADKIITASDFVKNVFLKRYKNNSVTITPGTDINIFKPNARLKSKRPNILIVAGQLTKAEAYKGLHTLIQSTKELKDKLPDILLTVVGDGEMRGEYEMRVKDLGLEDNVIFKGRLGGMQLAKEYQKAHIFVSPSTNDNIPTVIIEAMATGLPVVAYGVGAVASLIDNYKTGFVIKAGDKQNLTQKIYDLLSDPKKAKEFGLAGQIKAKSNFDWKVKTQETNFVLNNILKQCSTIAHIVGYYPPHIGGMEIVAQQIAGQLAQDYKVKVITSNIDAKYVPAYESKGALEIQRLKSIEIAHTPIIWSLFTKLLTLPKDSILHVHIAQALTPEIALLAAKIRNYKFIAHFHLDVEPSGLLGGLFIFYKKFILGRVLQSADMVIVFSEEQSRLVRRLYSVKNSKIAIIPNGVGKEYFHKAKKLNSKSKLNLLYVGRLTVQKRVDRLVEALSKVDSPVYLSIVGDGEDKQKLKTQAKSLGLKNISFEGRKKGKELIKYYQKADAFLISSDKEGMPLVVLEAMACGLPIIASNVLGLAELVKGTGILVNSPYSKTFANTIDKLSKNRKLLNSLSKKSIKKAQDHTWDKVVEKIELIYEKI